MHSHAISGISSIRASGDISGVSITTVTGTMSSTSCNIQTTNGTVSVKNGLFQNQSCTGTSRQTTTPTVVGVCTCMDSITACGIDISCTQLQYIYIMMLLIFVWFKTGEWCMLLKYHQHLTSSDDM